MQQRQISKLLIQRWFIRGEGIVARVRPHPSAGFSLASQGFHAANTLAGAMNAAAAIVDSYQLTYETNHVE